MIRVRKVRSNEIKYCTHCDKPAKFLLYYTNPKIIDKSANGALCSDCLNELVAAILKYKNPSIKKDERKYSREDWMYEVANGDTNLGYHEWYEHMIESEDE